MKAYNSLLPLPSSTGAGAGARRGWARQEQGISLAMPLPPIAEVLRGKAVDEAEETKLPHLQSQSQEHHFYVSSS